MLTRSSIHLDGFDSLSRVEQDFFWQDFDYKCARKIAKQLKNTKSLQNDSMRNMIAQKLNNMVEQNKLLIQKSVNLFARKKTGQDSAVRESQLSSQGQKIRLITNKLAFESKISQLTYEREFEQELGASSEESIQ